MQLYAQGNHGLADILLGPQRPCSKDSPDGKCVCDGSSYFPVIRPAPYSCGKDTQINNMYITHPADMQVSACNDCVGQDRMACNDGVKCFCSQDCPPGYVCDTLNNTCVKPSSLKPDQYYRLGGNVSFLSDQQPDPVIKSSNPTSANPHGMTSSSSSGGSNLEAIIAAVVAIGIVLFVVIQLKK